MMSRVYASKGSSAWSDDPVQSTLQSLLSSYPTLQERSSALLAPLHSFGALSHSPECRAGKLHSSLSPFPENWEERCLSDPGKGGGL